jgi:acyl-CoA synthetase (AMP-forming)/AMP-acid ligase II
VTIAQTLGVSRFNVYPTEVEEVICRHPKVAKVAVAGIPDQVTGEAIKAFVVLREGEAATTQEMIAWCRDPDTGLTGTGCPSRSTSGIRSPSPWWEWCCDVCSSRRSGPGRRAPKRP